MAGPSPKMQVRQGTRRPDLFTSPGEWQSCGRLQISEPPPPCVLPGMGLLAVV